MIWLDISLSGFILSLTSGSENKLACWWNIHHITLWLCNKHYSYYIIIHHSFSIPKLRYLLRTAPCFLSSLLEEYDHTLRTILSSVTNTPLLHNDRAWLQAVRPVKSGELGVRRAADLAPAAYLASTYSTANLVSAILGQHSSSQSLPPAPFSESAVEK